jgi:hypothetical protein
MISNKSSDQCIDLNNRPKRLESQKPVLRFSFHPPHECRGSHLESWRFFLMM